MSYAHNKAWRRRYPEKRNAERAANYARTRALARRCRETWSGEELLAIFAPDKPSDRELAAVLGRSVQAIQVKRAKTPNPYQETTAP